MYSEIELDTTQQEAVDKMHNGCILNGGTGSGKTRTALTYYYTKVCGGVVGEPDSMRTPKDLYVITTAKKRDSQDWQNYAVYFNISTEREYTPHAVKIVVDSWNNLEKYREVKNAHFIFDEQRVVGSGAWTTHFLRVARENSWILLSATPGDNWLDYIPVFVANGFYKNRSEFKREHVVYNNYAKFPKVDRYTNVGRLVRYRNSILVDLPYEKLTTRHLNYIDCKYDTELYQEAEKKRWHVYEERPIRDIAELLSVMRKIVNSDSSRLHQLNTILKSHSKVIVFYNFDYELEMLRGLAGSDSISTPLSHTSQTSSLERTECLTTCPQTSIDDKQNNQDIAGGTSQRATQLAEPHTAHSTLVSTEQSVRTRENLARDETQTYASPKDVMEKPAFAIAEWNGHKHEAVPSTERWVYLVQYAAGSEGWNCVETDAMVFWSQTYSYKMFDQAQGRIDRRNTQFRDLYYYIFTSKSSVDKAIEWSLKLKKNFNERKFMAKYT